MAPIFMVTNHIRVHVGEAMLVQNDSVINSIQFNPDQFGLTALFADKWLGKSGFKPKFEIKRNSAIGLLEVVMTLPEKDSSMDDLSKTESLSKVFRAMPYQEQAKFLVFDYIRHHLDKSDKDFGFSNNDVYVVWWSKTLQNWKALLSSTLPDGMYYEVTFDGDKNQAYLDAYKKFDNVCFPFSKEVTGAGQPEA